jgi:hypothetical protein
LCCSSSGSLHLTKSTGILSDVCVPARASSAYVISSSGTPCAVASGGWLA